MVRWTCKTVVEGPTTLMILSTYLKPLSAHSFPICYTMHSELFDFFFFHSTNLLFNSHIFWALVLPGFTFSIILIISALYLENHQNFWSTGTTLIFQYSYEFSLFSFLLFHRILSGLKGNHTWLRCIFLIKT